MKYKFERDPEGETIVIFATFNDEYKIRMLLDTGASVSSIDSNTLLMEGFDLSEPIGFDRVETANGIIDVELFHIDTLSTLGNIKRGIEIQIFDYIKHDIRSNYQGILGLDFFEGTSFTVDMVNNTIEVIKV